MLLMHVLVNINPSKYMPSGPLMGHEQTVYTHPKQGLQNEASDLSIQFLLKVYIFIDNLPLRNKT